MPKSRSMDRPEYAEMLVRLRRARRNAGLTEADVETALRLPTGRVAKCEAGTYRIDPLELSDFATLYGQPIDSFVRTPRGRPTARS